VGLFLNSTKPSYRADVDGLRAVAVLGVLAFHFDSVTAFPGGYLGVDVFFVISGFVIFKSILFRLEESSFSLIDFFSARARRLLPAFLVVIFFAFLGILTVGGPSQIENAALSALFAVAGVSNFYFLSQDSYWAESERLEPFLHTW